MADLLSKHKWFFWISENSKKQKQKQKKHHTKSFLHCPAKEQKKNKG